MQVRDLQLGFKSQALVLRLYLSTGGHACPASWQQAASGLGADSADDLQTSERAAGRQRWVCETGSKMALRKTLRTLCSRALRCMQCGTSCTAGWMPSPRVRLVS
jgi:hypothetical protein